MGSALDAPFAAVAGATGVPIAEIKMVSTFLISYPLGALLTRIPATRPNIAHLYSIFISVFYIWPLLGMGAGLGHLLLDCTVTYGLVVAGRGSKMPWIVFGFVMTHLLLLHTHRTMFGLAEGEADITFPMMMMVQKLTMFAWNVHDGRSKVEDLDASQLATRLSHVPSPLPFLGYCFFFPSFLAGPTFDYATYDALVLHRLYTQAPVPTPSQVASGSKGAAELVAAEKETRRRVPYGRKRVAYLQLVLGLTFMGVYATYGSRGNYERILGNDWLRWGWVTRFGFVQLAGVVSRTKYYGVWCLCEGACVLTGVGFNGYDPKTGRTLWNRVRNINILDIEMAESFKVLFDSWNCRTNVWLRDCVYKRLVKKGQKPGTRQTLATFLTSAIWHGIEPGYYLAFLSAGLLTSLGRQCRNYIRPYFIAPSSASKSVTSGSTAPNSLPQYPYPNKYKRLYDIIGWALVQSNINYVATSFILLDFKRCVGAYQRMGWYAHVMIIGGMAFFHFGGRRALRRNLPAGAAKGKAKVGAKDAAPLGKEAESSGTTTALNQVSGVPSISISKPSSINDNNRQQEEDERNEKDFRWVKHALEAHEKRHDTGGMGADGGFVDSVMRGAETPAVEMGTPRWSRDASPDR